MKLLASKLPLRDYHSAPVWNLLVSLAPPPNGRNCNNPVQTITNGHPVGGSVWKCVIRALRCASSAYRRGPAVIRMEETGFWWNRMSVTGLVDAIGARLDKVIATHPSTS